MKTRKLLLFTVAALTIVSCASHKTQVQRDIQEYATVTVPVPDLSGISDNGKEVLNLYRFAADEADKIYWKQYFGDKSVIDSIADPSVREFAYINYGPWSRISGKAFIEGYGERPAGAGFYPVDMTAEEFAAATLEDKDSPYTIIRRTDDGSLAAVWFHDEFAEEIEKIANCLTAAADITIKSSVRNYLLKKVEGLRSDNYYESDIAWLDMTDSKMDLVIGPNETNDDQLEGIKKSFGALVLLKNLSETDRLMKYTAIIPELQEELPCAEQYKTFKPGTGSNIFFCEALYYAGSYNAGIKEIAINLPYDEQVQKEKGTRTILLGNVIDAKFNSILSPVGNLFFEGESKDAVDKDAFRFNIAFREIAHGLGVKETVSGKGSVDAALGNHALTWEEAKANVVGNYLVCKLLERHDVDALITKENAMATFVASLLRAQRFGEAEALGRGNIMILNYLVKNGAISRNASGKYALDYAKIQDSIRDLAGIILKTQAEGDLEFAEKFEAEYGALPSNFEEDKTLMNLEGIPVDVRFDFKK